MEFRLQQRNGAQVAASVFFFFLAFSILLEVLMMCLENSMDKGTWWATVYGVAKSQTRLSN